jgi:hypothetical protein
MEHSPVENLIGVDTVSPSDSRHGCAFNHRLFDDLPFLRDRPELAFRALGWANDCP